MEGIKSVWVDLRNLVLWSKEWHMLFDVDKCKVMHLGYNNPKVNYIVEAAQLQDVDEVTDLGIIVVSDDLKCRKNSVLLQLNKQIRYLKW